MNKSQLAHLRKKRDLSKRQLVEMEGDDRQPDRNNGIDMGKRGECLEENGSL